jgi:hypothetical protein
MPHKYIYGGQKEREVIEELKRNNGISGKQGPEGFGHISIG